MLRSFSCVALFAFLSVSIVHAAEKAKAPAPPQKPAAAQPAKVQAASWLPRELQGTQAANRLAVIQAELDAAIAQRGPARQEADKARSLAFKAEQKADDLKRKVDALEKAKASVFERGLAEAHEAAQQKAAFETSLKVRKLEAQLRDVSAQLAAAKQPKK